MAVAREAPRISAGAVFYTVGIVKFLVD